MSSGRTFWSNSSGVKRPRATVASLRVVPSLCAFFAALATSGIEKNVEKDYFDL